MAKSQTPAPEPIEEVLPPIVEAAPNDEVEAPTTGLKKFECWQARPEYLFRMNPKTGEQERYLAEVEKTGAKPLFTTHIEQHHADTLNAQVENSGQYYFAV